MLDQAAAGNAEPHYLRWATHGLPPVTIRRGVAVAMQAEVMRAFNAVPKRGAEVGGVLLGSRTESGIVVDDFEPAPCEHRFGPSYRLSDTDRAALVETLNWFHTQPRHGLAVVGFFRSHTRADFALSPEDVELFGDLFPDPAQVFLLIKPDRWQNSVADFFFRRNGELQQALHLAKFPFENGSASGKRPRANGSPEADIGAWSADPPLAMDQEAPLASGAAVRRRIPPAFSPQPPLPDEGPPAVSPAGEAVADETPAPASREPEAPEPEMAAAPAIDEPPAGIRPEPQPIAPEPVAPQTVRRAEPEPESPPTRKRGPGPFPPPRPRPEPPPPRHTWTWGALAAVVAIIGGAFWYQSVHPPAPRQPAPDRTSTPSSAPATVAPPVAPPSQVPQTQAPPPAAEMPSQTAPPAAQAPAAGAPAPPPVSEPQESKSAGSPREQIDAVLNRWSAAIRRGDAAALLSCYSAVVNPYHGRRNARAAEIRRQLEYIRGRYGKLAIHRVGGLSIRQVSANMAIATFTRHWETAGRYKQAGEDRQRMTLVRTPEGWKIGSEDQPRASWVHRAR